MKKEIYLETQLLARALIDFTEINKIVARANKHGDYKFFLENEKGDMIFFLHGKYIIVLSEESFLRARENPELEIGKYKRADWARPYEARKTWSKVVKEFPLDAIEEDLLESLLENIIIHQEMHERNIYSSLVMRWLLNARNKEELFKRAQELWEKANRQELEIDGEKFSIVGEWLKESIIINERIQLEDY